MSFNLLQKTCERKMQVDVHCINGMVCGFQNWSRNQREFWGSQKIFAYIVDGHSHTLFSLTADGLKQYWIETGWLIEKRNSTPKEILCSLVKLFSEALKIKIQRSIQIKMIFPVEFRFYQDAFFLYLCVWLFLFVCAWWS